jgi:hypothetical protein
MLLAALIAVKPRQRPRLIYRVHAGSRLGGDTRTGFTAADHARMLDAAHQQLDGPVVPVWGNPEHPRQPGDGRPAACPGLADGLPAPAARLRAQPGRRDLVRARGVRGRPGQARHHPQLTALVRSGSGGCSSGPAWLLASWQATDLGLTPLEQPPQLAIVTQAAPVRGKPWRPLRRAPRASPARSLAECRWMTRTRRTRRPAPPSLSP